MPKRPLLLRWLRRKWQKFLNSLNQASGGKPVASNVAIAAASLALWAGLVLLFAVPLALTSSVSRRQTLSFAASFWALWLLFLPIVSWLAFRFPIGRRKLARNLGLHLAACLLLVGSNRISFRVIEHVSPRAQRPPPSAPPAAFGVFLGMRAALDVLVYWSLVGACQAIANFQKSQERERRAIELEARLASAKLEALRMQINPHFLFNTLNSIAALVYSNPRAADEMLGDLSGLLRRALDSTENEIPLAQELEFIGAYLSIEQKRFGDRLQVEQRIPEELMKAMVPALLLQPLVENAVRHGIEPQREPGVITIEARREDQRLRLVVRDNGGGFSAANGPDGKRNGIGLANTQARLQQLYGREHRFSFGAAEPRGCRVDIQLPLHYEAARAHRG